MPSFLLREVMGVYPSAPFSSGEAMEVYPRASFFLGKAWRFTHAFLFLLVKSWRFTHALLFAQGSCGGLPMSSFLFTKKNLHTYKARFN
jgi:hypothetical protein